MSNVIKENKCTHDFRRVIMLYTDNDGKFIGREQVCQYCGHRFYEGCAKYVDDVRITKEIAEWEKEQS